MEKLPMCRLCMAENVRLLNIVNTQLQEMFESLLLIPLETDDSRPITACYICCARLANCYQLRKRGLRSEQLFPQILNSRMLRAKRVTNDLKNSLGITAVVHLSVGEVSKENRESLVQLNTLDVLEEYGVEINEEKDERPFYKRSIQLLEDVEALEYIINIVKQELSDEEINSIYLEGDSQLSEVVPYSGQHLALLDVENNERQDSNNNSMSDQDVEVISPPMVIEDVVDTTSDKQEETVADEGINKTCTDDNTPETVTVKRLTVEDMIGYSGGLRVYGSSPYTIKYSTCDICREGFIKKVDLLKHKLAVHPRVRYDDGKNEFIDAVTELNEITTDVYLRSDKCKCSACVNNFFMFQYPYMPVVEEPHKCDKCNESDVHSSVSNQKSVHDPKPHPCTECKKSFDLKSELVAHLSVHTGENHMCATLVTKVIE
ncbi:unnamed protein product [Arctia plantaginis]|uniref:Uncharacterized protein n=1 Tax=Arctia plantaginis TaxID=874455 RepID=A0A8S1AZP0_ARCPL|nr:unnamed protein product [Arctia plantaginis]